MPRRLLSIALLVPIVLVAACDTEPSGPGPSDEKDLTIRFIERLPRLEYVPDSDDPAHDGWPEPGQTVTWRAHVRNWSEYARQVPYSWELDGEPAGAGVMEIPAKEEGTADLDWEWTFDRHTVTFTVDPEDIITEEEEGNNTRTLFTDALSVGFWVERPVIDAFRQIQPQLIGRASTSFEDWAHRHIERYNQMAASAIYPETPDGVLDRWRLDRIVVVPGGTFDFPQHPVEDRTVDLMWGFPAAVANLYWQFLDAGLEGGGPDVYNGTLIHELGHARYLVDVYRTQVLDGIPGHSIDVTENGERIVGTDYMPTISGYSATLGGQTYDGFLVRRPIMAGLMDRDYTFIDRYSAAALNRIAGFRPVAGNYNAPANVGAFLTDLPAEMGIRVLDAGSGAALDGADVTEYQSDGGYVEDVGFGRIIDDIPDLHVTANADGVAWLGAAPFKFADLVVENLFAGTVLIRVEHQGRVGYAFLDAMYYNMAYWRGETESAVLDLEVTLH